VLVRIVENEADSRCETVVEIVFAQDVAATAERNGVAEQEAKQTLLVVDVIILISLDIILLASDCDYTRYLRFTSISVPLLVAVSRMDRRV
jgi:hypothetical protein